MYLFIFLHMLSQLLVGRMDAHAYAKVSKRYRFGGRENLKGTMNEQGEDSVGPPLRQVMLFLNVESMLAG